MGSMVSIPVTFSPSVANTLETVTNITSHAEVQGPVCGTQIGRLRALMSDLEAKYGYDELRRGIRHGGQVMPLLVLLQNNVIFV